LQSITNLMFFFSYYQDVAQFAHRLKQQPISREAIAEFVNLSKHNEQLLNGHSSKVNGNEICKNKVHS
jgi:hypothetical protein